MGQKRLCFKRCIWAFMVIGLTGCMSATHHQAPFDGTTHMAGSWHSDALENHTALDSQRQPGAAWWRRFGDQELTGLVEKLAGSNPALAEARERIVAAYTRRPDISSAALRYQAAVVRTQAQILELRAVETSALESVTLAESLFDAGLGDLFQVLDARKQLVSIQESLLLAQQRALAEVVYLYRALGGGWEDDVSSEQETGFEI